MILLSSSSTSELTGLAGWVADVVSSLGPLGVGLLVALENLFPPIPSEVVLPVAGFVASQGRMSLVWALVAANLGSLLGAYALYWLGASVGPQRLRSWTRRMPLMDVDDFDKSQAWFNRYGGIAVLIGRCVPVVRSLVSVPAGVQQMGLWRFTFYTLLGSSVWNGALVTGGYVLGDRWQDIGAYSDWLNGVVYVVIAVLLVRFVVTRLRKRSRLRI